METATAHLCIGIMPAWQLGSALADILHAHKRVGQDDDDLAFQCWTARSLADGAGALHRITNAANAAAPPPRGADGSRCPLAIDEQ